MDIELVGDDCRRIASVSVERKMLIPISASMNNMNEDHDESSPSL